MAELARQEQQLDVVDPRTGEIAATAAQVVDIREWCTREQQSLAAVKRLADLALERLSQQQGAKTFRVGSREVVVGRKTRIHWDLTELRELRELGLPDDRWHELVGEPSYKPRAVVANQLAAANPKYRAVLERARTDEDLGVTVTVK